MLRMKKLILPAIVVAALALFQLVGRESATAPATAPLARSGDSALLRAIQSRADGVQVEGEGRVVRILADDHDGSRHQRIIVRVSTGQTLLIAHNIDLAPRVTDVSEGDLLTFNGEYAWNDKGGVVHWTHRDPRGQHPAGWIRHAGRVFQ